MPKGKQRKSVAGRYMVVWTVITAAFLARTPQRPRSTPGIRPAGRRMGPDASPTSLPW